MRSLLFLTCALLMMLPSVVRGQEAISPPPRFVEERLDASRSSWIQDASFSKETHAARGRLTVQIGGKKTTYIEVPAGVWAEFKKAESLGRFYAERIKNRYEREPGEPLSARHDFVAQAAVTALVECAFNEECEPLILRHVDAARESILVAAYAFTRTRIADALVRARERGVNVRMKVDAHQADYPLAARQLQYLESRGVPVTRITMQGEYSAMHNKFVVVDGRYVIAGSYNYTTTAGAANWENVAWMDSPEIAGRYTKAWETITSE
jgi:phosphatidylserine/phosphatidylglycerophosphate/cardiolipin synthase-like enzyme